MIACDLGLKDAVQFFLNHSEDKNIDLNVQDEYGFTVFMNACDSGDEDIVQLLLEYFEDRNIDLNARDGYEI